MSAAPYVSLPDSITYRLDGTWHDSEIVPINGADLVWECCAVRCRGCGESWYAIVEIGADEKPLACPSCKQAAGRPVAKCHDGDWSMTGACA